MLLWNVRRQSKKDGLLFKTMPKLKQAETEIVYVKATTQEVSFEWFLHCGVKNVQSVHD